MSAMVRCACLEVKPRVLLTPNSSPELQAQAPVFYFEKVSYRPGWSWTYSVAMMGLELLPDPSNFTL